MKETPTTLLLALSTRRRLRWTLGLRKDDHRNVLRYTERCLPLFTFDEPLRLLELFGFVPLVDFFGDFALLFALFPGVEDLLFDLFDFPDENVTVHSIDSTCCRCGILTRLGSLLGSDRSRTEASRHCVVRMGWLTLWMTSSMLWRLRWISMNLSNGQTERETTMIFSLLMLCLLLPGDTTVDGEPSTFDLGVVATNGEPNSAVDPLGEMSGEGKLS